MEVWATPAGVGSGKGLLRAGPASAKLATHNWAEIDTTVQDTHPHREVPPASSHEKGTKDWVHSRLQKEFDSVSP